jgi:hypothetical protein
MTQLQSFALITFCLIKSQILPGVPTIIFAPFSINSFCFSALSPPITLTEWIPKGLPKSEKTLWVCWASSRVGLSTMYISSLSFLKICSSTGIANDPVFPLPVSACAKISLFSRIMGIVRAWIGEAFSKPRAFRLPISFSLRLNSEKGVEVSIVLSFC